MNSPDYIRISLAAGITLGISKGRFYRNATLGCINILLNYEEGCSANCAYCGLSKVRPGYYEQKSFIRVKWPLVKTDEVIKRIKQREDIVERVCISMITKRKSIYDTMNISKRIKMKSSVPISFLISPTITFEKDLKAFKEAGADKIGIAIDAATPEIFKSLRGEGVKGPHKWEKYLKIFDAALNVFGERNVGSHFVVGLGESEKEMAYAIWKIRSMGGETHLFSFYPEPGSLMAKHQRPSIPHYRRIQLARYLIDEDIITFDMLKFNKEEQITSYGIDITPYIEEGEAFRTSGCKGNKGRVACNRPYANERPSEELRNFPFKLEAEDIRKIKREIWDYTK